MLRAAIPLLLATATAACGADGGDRTAIVVGAITAADEAIARARPGLLAGKYALMASDTVSFYRGNLPVFLRDWEAADHELSRSAFARDGAPGIVVGDPHPENFGVLLGADGSFGLEPNDFDSADRGPYLWDVRRLVVGVSLAARLSNAADPAARAAAAAASRDVARAAAIAYAQAIEAFAAGAPHARIAAPREELVVSDLFDRAVRDRPLRTELSDLTRLGPSGRTLVRGPITPDEPTNALVDLPTVAIDALPATLARYRASLEAPPPPEFFTVLDAARELGSGVASWPRVRAIVLLRGPSDDAIDDVVIEVKELADAALPVEPPPAVAYDDVPSRVIGTARTAWFGGARAAPLWGASTWLGMPVQVRLESGAQKTARVSRLEKKRGTPEAITAFARVLGALLARVHASDAAVGAVAIRAAIGADPAGFADEQADVGDAYAAQVLDDHARFRAAIADLGPTLGVAPSDDPPPPDLRALLADPGLPPAP